MHNRHHKKIHRHMTMAGHKGHRSQGRGGGRGRGRGRGRHAPPEVSATQLSSWFAGSLPDDWFTEPVTITVDRDEILVTGSVAMPKVAKSDDPELAAQARIATFREDTREARMAIADRAQNEFKRVVSWAVTCGDQSMEFTTAGVPVMTRLRFDERAVLDTLIDAGVARSRSEALAWCVHLVGENEGAWIDKLRAAMTDVERLRNEGPDSRAD